MRVLHFLHHETFNCRFQRAVQSCIDLGLDASVYCNSYVDDGDFWIPDKDRVEVRKFRSDWHWFLMHPSPKKDYFGLRKIFERLDCDVVHAHELLAARYSFMLGLPTVFDDWEYYWRYYSVAPAPTLKGKMTMVYRRLKAESAILDLIWHVPTLVTNRNVAEKYNSLGAVNVKVVPNVPLCYERDYARKVNNGKRAYPSFAYVGDLRQVHPLRTASEVLSLNLDCHEFCGVNYVPHLEMMKTLSEFHFNLLYWKPHKLHKYYLQNKAFLASVLGIPTIISKSLSATMDLLGLWAIPISKPKEILQVIKNYEGCPWKVPIMPSHFMEYYSDRLLSAYKDALDCGPEYIRDYNRMRMDHPQQFGRVEC